MVKYYVRWSICDDLAKGRGKRSSKEILLGFTVLCRTSKDALKCLDYHFRKFYPANSSFGIDDGEISLKRCTIDSRNFTADYLLMDGIREPLELSDLKSNGLRALKIFM